MPAFSALALITSSVQGGLASAGLSAAASAAGANLLVGGGLSVLSQALLAPKPSTGGGVYKTVINQADAWRVRGYGRYKLGGVRAFLRTKQGRLYQVILVHQGRISAFRDIYIGDMKLVLDGEGRATNGSLTHGGSYYVAIQTRVGLDNSPAYQRLIDDFPTQWSAQHQINGVATIFALFRSPNIKRYNKVFPEGPNSPIRAVCDLSPVLDPRTGVTAWSRNSALCFRDYLTDGDGYRLPRELIGAESWKRFADRCDETVQRPNGATEPRYALGGVYSLGDAPLDTMQRFLATCDGELFLDAEGRICIRGGAWSAPTATFGPDQIRSHSLSEGADRFAAFNRLRVTYTQPSQDYKTADFIAWEDLDSQAIVGRREETLPLDWVQSPSQAKRLARIYAAKRNPRWMGTITTDLSGLAAYGASDDNPDNGRIIRIILPELGINDTFWVESVALRGDLSGVEFQVRSLSADAYAPVADPGNPVSTPDDAETEEIPPPVVASLVVSSGRLRLTAEAPEFDGLALDAQWRPAGGDYWDQMTTDAPLVATAGPAVGGAYEARARWLTPGGDETDWGPTVSA